MSLIEIIAVVFGLLCVWLTTRQNIWCWPTGLVQVVLFIFIFYEAKLYSDVALHGIYVVLQFYGWYHWLHGRRGDSPLPVTRMRPQAALRWAGIAVIATIADGLLMDRVLGADLPYWDAAIVVLSLIATYLMARKVLESWLIWIAVDVLGVGVYWAKALYLTAGLYGVFLCLATWGFFAWKKTITTPATQATAPAMMLGKFLPPHLGHVYLADFARRFVDRLTILVCSLEREPIPGRLRYEWMRELFPDCNVVPVADDLPQEPDEHPQFWSIWRDTVLRAMGQPPEFVFASESYGFELARVLDARFIPCDIGRTIVPVSGTAIRSDPMANWRYLPACVRPYFVKRVCIFGPESTGKSTLARDLASHYHTVYAAEFARGLLDHKAGHCDAEDIPLIARGQIASEDALARQASRVLFCDTDTLTTTIWSRVLFNDCPAWIDDLAKARAYDLTLLLDVDVPWVDDTQRYLPHLRRAFFERCQEALEKAGRRYVVIRGDWKGRFDAACKAVDALLTESASPHSPL